MKIGIIGAGNMGGAIYKALAQAFPKNSVLITDRNAKKIKALGAKKISTDKLIEKCDVLILAIKPQSFVEFCVLTSRSLKNKLVISIVAGLPLKQIAFGTGALRVVRAMPNLPARVSYGLTGWVANKGITKKNKLIVEKIFATLGNQIEVKEEAAINSLTALSGSGPAYFFYLTELLQESAQSFGFSESASRLIAEMTFVGAAKLMHENKLSAAEWRKAVTSPKGTTEAAIKSLQKNKFNKIFQQAIVAAKQRAEELSK